MTRLLLVLFALLAPTWAYAETLYVRAASGEYGAEDGSNYANAFDDFDDIVWGGAAGQLGPGDTLIVCGTFTTLTLQAKLNGTAGSPITIDGDCSGQGDLSRAVLDASIANLSDTQQMIVNRWQYGAGPSGIGYTYLTFKNFRVILEAGETFEKSGVLIEATSAPNVVDRTVPVNITLDSFEVSSTGTYTTDTEVQVCLSVKASNVKVTNSTIHDCPNDGIYAEGNNNELSNLWCYNIDLQTSAPGGDCIQFGGAVGIQNTGNWIHHNLLDARGTSAKMALMLSGDSDLVQNNTVEYNTLYGGATVLNLNPSGGTFRYNLLYSTVGGQGTPRGVVNIENQVGNNLATNTINMSGNLIVGEQGVYTHGIYAVVAGLTNRLTLNLVNNTIIGFTTTGVQCSGGVGVMTCNIQNNIVQSTSGTQAFSFGSLTTTVRRNNIWFGTGIKDQGGGAADNSTGDLNVNPLLINPSIAVGTFSCCGGVAMPGVVTGSPARGDHKTKPTSPARRAGTPSGLCADVRGRVCYPDRPDIGAYQASSGDLAVSRTARTP